MAALTTDFLCLSFCLEVVKAPAEHRVCVGVDGPHTGRRVPDALNLCSPDPLGESDPRLSVSWFPSHRCLASYSKHLDSGASFWFDSRCWSVEPGVRKGRPEA